MPSKTRDALENKDDKLEQDETENFIKKEQKISPGGSPRLSLLRDNRRDSKKNGKPDTLEPPKTADEEDKSTVPSSQ